MQNLKMTDEEAVKVINRIRACRYDEKCKFECEKCPCNYTDEELHEALRRGSEALKERSQNVRCKE